MSERQSNLDRMHETYSRDTYDPDAPDLLRMVENEGRTPEGFLRAVRKLNTERRKKRTDAVASKLEHLMIAIRAFPRSRKLYDELFNLVRDSLGILEDVRKSGFLERITSGRIGERYSIEYHWHLIPFKGIAKSAVIEPYQDVNESNPGILVSRVWTPCKRVTKIAGYHYKNPERKSLLWSEVFEG